MCLQGVDVDIFARDSSILKGNVRVVVGMDDGVRNIHGSAEARSDAHLFLMNVAGISRFHIHISGSRQGSPAADRGVDALLPGIRRVLCINRRRKAYLYIPGIRQILIRGTQPKDLCILPIVVLDANGAFGLRTVHVAKLLINFIFSELIGALPVFIGSAHESPIFIFGIAELGIGDALVDGGNAHIDAYAEAACGSARQ